MLAGWFREKNGRVYHAFGVGDKVSYCGEVWTLDVDLSKKKSDGAAKRRLCRSCAATYELDLRRAAKEANMQQTPHAEGKGGDK
jgi:hypothetical protein